MKKRAWALLLAFALAVACALPVFAAQGFDLNVLRNGEDILYSEGSSAAYVLRSISINGTDTFYSQDGSRITFTPTVCALRNPDVGFYVFEVNFASNRFLNMRSVTFVVNNKSYTFHSFPSLYYDPSNTKSGLYEETTMLGLTDGSIQMMEEIVNNRNNQGNPVVVVVEGQNETLSMALNDELVNGMIHLYNLYVEAGGMEAENLQRIPREMMTSYTYRVAS